MRAVFGRRENKHKPLGSSKVRLCQRRGHYIPPPCISLADVARLVLDNEPSDEYLAGFAGCLEALSFDPRCFLEMAFRVRGGWSAYHSLDEVARLCGPAVQEFATIVIHALAGE